jgi:4-methyl-5(b-hydroxyethyl)-thiazole monophosphate biosynthesis
MAKVLVLLAEGCEEIEAVTAIDVLRRAEFHVTVAGLRAGVISASRGVKLAPDALLADVKPLDYDAIVVPGGYGGVQNLLADPRALDAIRALYEAGRWVCSICAGPLVLEKAGVLAGKRATCYPGVELSTTTRVEERVVVDGKLITSQGPGTSMAFALEIVKQLGGPALAQKVASALLA